MKIGIIGVGNMGKLHAGLIKSNPGLTLYGMTDMNAARAAEVAADFGCQAFASVSELLASEVDMVFITVPNTAHGPLAIQALQARKHVFVEKPLATKLEDAAEIRRLQTQTGLHVFVGYNRRFAPVYLAAKDAISDVGFKPVNVNMIQNDGDMQNPPWLTDITMTGGFMYDTTVHFLDMARFLLGDITELRSLGAASFYPIEDNFVVQLKFKNGAFGVITSCGHASWISPFERVQVVGDHKSVITEELDSYRYSASLGAIVEGKEFTTLEHNVKWGYAQMHDHMFRECISNGAAPKNSVDDGYKVVKLIEACYASAKAGGSIITF